MTVLLLAQQVPAGGAVSHAHPDYWIFGVLLFMLTVLAFTRAYYAHFIGDRLRAYSASRYLKQLMRKELVLYHPYSLITLLLFAMAASLVALRAAELYQPQLLRLNPYFTSDYAWFMAGTLVVLVWVIVRALVLKTAQFIIGADFGQTENRYRIVVFNQVCGYVLIPLVSMAFFVASPVDAWLVWLCGGILVLNYIYRLVQSFITAFQYSVNHLYLFLYLCTLEIVPLLLILSVLLY